MELTNLQSESRKEFQSKFAEWFREYRNGEPTEFEIDVLSFLAEREKIAYEAGIRKCVDVIENGGVPDTISIRTLDGYKYINREQLSNALTNLLT